MLMSKKITLSLLVFLSITLQSLKAQQWLGRTTGNYSGTYGLYNNAASIADSKYKYYFNFWGRGVNFYNNYLTYNAPLKLNHWANDNVYAMGYKDYTGKMQMGNDWFLENLNGKDKQFSFNQDIWGPAFLFPVGPKWQMSVNTRQRSGLQFFGLPEAVARLAKNGIDSGSSAQINKAFSANAQTYQELSFTLGGNIIKNKHHDFNIGATLKFIRGLGAAYVYSDQFNINGLSQNAASINGNLNYGATDDNSLIAPYNNPYGLFSLNSRGAGLGIDLGLNYTFRKDELRHKGNYNITPWWYCDLNDRKSDYDFKISAALNDVGGIRYNRHSNAYAYASSVGNVVNTSSSVLNGFNRYQQVGFDSVNAVFDGLSATKTSGFKTGLPTALNLQLDFRLKRNVYMNVFWNQNLRAINTAGLRSTSMLSFIPRYESRGFEFSMPITISENYQNLYIGTYTRIGPFFFGSDNLGGLLNVASNAQFMGADIYGGIAMGIGFCGTLYKNPVDPVYIDTVKQRDTIKLVAHDTTYIIKQKTDTVFVQKTTNKQLSDKENELKQKEQVLIKRQAELDAREKTLNTKNTTTPVDCGPQIKILKDENTILKNKINEQDQSIVQLNQKINELTVIKVNLQNKCNEDKVKTDAEIARLNNELNKAKQQQLALESEVAILKKAAANKTDATVLKGTDAEKLAQANKQNDSFKLRILYLQNDIDLCKKTSNTNQSKTQNDAKVYQNRIDSLQGVVKIRLADLDLCKKNAELEKAKIQNDAKIAQKKVDSLQLVLTQKTTDLDNCKKSGTQNNAEVQKLKNCEDENANLKLEIQAMSKTIGQLNTKNYALSYKVDSLMAALKDCSKNSNNTNNNTDAELLKKCLDEQTQLQNEISQNKALLAAKNNSIDSLNKIIATQKQQQVELNAQISKLNSDISQLKNNSSNCDDLQKQLDAKTAELSKLKTDYNNLDAQFKKLNSQFEEYKVEYNYWVKQSQKCSAQLDSCKRGLYNTNTEPGSGDGAGSSSGSGNNGGPLQGDNKVLTPDPNSQSNRGVEVGGRIINVLNQGVFSSGNTVKTTTNTPKVNTSNTNTSNNPVSPSNNPIQNKGVIAR